MKVSMETKCIPLLDDVILFSILFQHKSVSNKKKTHLYNLKGYWGEKQNAVQYKKVPS